jgi:predicted transport protein
MASPEEQLASMIANFKEKTGKTLEQWLKVTAKAGLAKHGEIVKLLKGEHGMGHGFANLVAARTLEAGAPAAGGDDLLAAQYAGPKADMKAVYDAVEKAARALGKDVIVRPLKTYVTLRRGKQFAIVKPSTKTRVDVGFNLKGVDPAGKLLPSGSLGSMVTHRMELTSPKDVNAEFKRWLKQAYQGA